LKEFSKDKNSPLIKEYVLPDYNKHFKGFIKEDSKQINHDEQTIKMGNS